MKQVAYRRRNWITHSIRILTGITLVFILFAPHSRAQTQAESQKPKDSETTYQTLYISHFTQQIDFNNIVTDLRNMIPRARIYGVREQSAISISATPEDLQLAKRMIADIDRPQKLYRLTYTIKGLENGKQVDTQHYAVIVSTGGKSTVLKQGNKVPIITGKAKTDDTSLSSQVQYVDVGLNIEASLDGMKLYTKIEQTSIVAEKATIDIQDPVLHQTSLQEDASITPGKPLVLGSLDVPGSTRHQEVELVAEPIQ